MLCLAALCPIQFGRGSWSLAGPGSIPLLGLLCCSHAAVSYCYGGAAVLSSVTCCCGTCGSCTVLSCCSHAPCVLQRGHGSTGWDLGSRARADPAALARAGTMAFLNYTPCTQPVARAKQLHLGPSPSASSPSHQLLVARMVTVTPSSEQCHPLPTAHPQVWDGENNSLAV